MSSPMEELNSDVLACRKCGRLAEWREECAKRPPRRFAGQTYHARPITGFGDPRARLLILGLAPAAHGANRTGRVFTGDRSGDWLFRALHRAGFANQPISASIGDGLRLSDAYITAACRCAPPGNKPLPGEFASCAEFLDREVDCLWPRLRVIVPLGALALSAALQALSRRGAPVPRPAPKFRHGGILAIAPDCPRILMSYHPSQQNTFTGVLTEAMFDGIWRRAADILDPERIRISDVP